MEFDRENPEKVNSGFSNWIGQTMEKAGRRGIQFTVLVSFTVVSVFIMVLLGFSLYQRFTLRTRAMMTESMEQLMSQTEANFEDYLTSMRRVSDAMYYDTIKDKDMALDSLSLLYEANKDNLISFALFKRDGSLVCAAPVSTMKEGMDVRLQPWFTMAMERPENLHFSTPHVQNIFNASSFRYYWVISLSRIVELTYSGVPVRGVLLVDMNYNTIEEMMDRVNGSNSYQYFYLCDSNGELIYHPRMIQIGVDKYRENNLTASDDQLYRMETGRRHSHERIQTRNGQHAVLYIPGPARDVPGPSSDQPPCDEPDHKPDPAPEPLYSKYGRRPGRS